VKYTIEGFSQAEAIARGMDVKDLVLLRWLLDFYNTGMMEIHMQNGKSWFWVDYRYAARELPVLGIGSAKVMARRMRRMVESCGIMESFCFEGAGCKTYFRFVEEALRRLLTDTERQGEFLLTGTGMEGGSTEKFRGGTGMDGGSTEKCRGVVPKSTGGLYRKVPAVDSSINDSSINDRERVRTKKNGAFVKPDISLVMAYCRERNNKVSAQRFIDYYESNGWKVGRNPMRDWKATVRRWELETKTSIAPGKPFKKQARQHVLEMVALGIDKSEIISALTEEGYSEQEIGSAMESCGQVFARR